MSDDELRRIREILEAILKAPGVQWTGAGATDKLRRTIKSFNRIATRQTATLSRYRRRTAFAVDRSTPLGRYRINPSRQRRTTVPRPGQTAEASASSRY
jgi:hypothetical protein